jgi:hypothetical protein
MCEVTPSMVMLKESKKKVMLNKLREKVEISQYHENDEEFRFIEIYV